MPPQPLKRFPAATTPIEEIVAAMHSDGGCIVERMYDAATITEMREAVLAKAARDADADAAPGSATFGYSTSRRRERRLRRRLARATSDRTQSASCRWARSRPPPSSGCSTIPSTKRCATACCFPTAERTG